MVRNLGSKIGISLAVAGLAALCFVKKSEGEVEIKEGLYQGVYHVKDRGVSQKDWNGAYILDYNKDGEADVMHIPNKDLVVGSAWGIGPSIEDFVNNQELRGLYKEVMKRWDEQNPTFGCPLRGLNYIFPPFF